MTDRVGIIDLMTLREGKKKVGISAPEPMLDAFTKLCDKKVDGKSYWAVLTAAMLVFMELPADQQDAAIARVMQEEAPGRSFTTLLPKEYRSRPSATIRKDGSIELRR